MHARPHTHRHRAPEQAPTQDPERAEKKEHDSPPQPHNHTRRRLVVGGGAPPRRGRIHSARGQSALKRLVQTSLVQNSFKRPLANKKQTGGCSDVWARERGGGGVARSPAFAVVAKPRSARVAFAEPREGDGPRVPLSCLVASRQLAGHHCIHAVLELSSNAPQSIKPAIEKHPNPDHQIIDHPGGTLLPHFSTRSLLNAPRSSRDDL